MHLKSPKFNYLFSTKMYCNKLCDILVMFGSLDANKNLKILKIKSSKRLSLQINCALILEKGWFCLRWQWISFVVSVTVFTYWVIFEVLVCVGVKVDFRRDFQDVRGFSYPWIFFAVKNDSAFSSPKSFPWFQVNLFSGIGYQK